MPSFRQPIRTPKGPPLRLALHSKLFRIFVYAFLSLIRSFPGQAVDTSWVVTVVNLEQTTVSLG